MDTLVAIPKAKLSVLAGESRRPRVSEMLAMSVDDGRGALIACGLHELPIESARLDRQPKEKNIQRKPGDLPRGFIFQDNIGAFIVNAGETTLRSAQEALGEDFHVIPDVALSVPMTSGNLEVDSGDFPTEWSEASGIRDAHASGVTGKGVIVAVVDTGCDADHREFSQRHLEFRYFPPTKPQAARAVRGFDPHGHGTHVTAIAAGSTCGIAPDAELLVASVIESESTQTSLMRIVSALNWLVAEVSREEHQDKPVILNMSLGFTPFTLSDAKHKAAVQAMRDLIVNISNNYNILVVMALGNEGEGTFRFPGGYPEGLGVGAVDFSGNPAVFSGSASVEFSAGQFVNKPDLVGYGVDIRSAFSRTTRGESQFVRQSGTSMAAPYVSGIAALMAQRYGLQGAALRNRVLSEVLPLQSPPARIGAGLARFV